MDSVYSGLAGFGQAYTIMGAVFATILGVFVIGNFVYNYYNYNTLSWIKFFIGLLLIIIPWIFVWLTFRYKSFAAVEGVAGGIEIVKNL